CHPAHVTILTPSYSSIHCSAAHRDLHSFPTRRSSDLQFNAIPQGVKFLVDLRADLLRFVTEDPLLKPLDRELETRLSAWFDVGRSEEHTSELQSRENLVCRLLLEKKKNKRTDCQVDQT